MAVSTAPLEPWRPTLDAYHRLVEIGALEDERVELLDGQIVAMSPRTREHDNAIEYLTRASPSGTAT